VLRFADGLVFLSNSNDREQTKTSNLLPLDIFHIRAIQPEDNSLLSESSLTEVPVTSAQNDINIRNGSLVDRFCLHPFSSRKVNANLMPAFANADSFASLSNYEPR
jgi:hypothetical protein